MKTIKPQKLSVMFRVFEHRGRKLFVPTIMLAFPLSAPEVMLHEVVLWKTIAAELGQGATLDEMMFKPNAEALLTGRAFAPNGTAAKSCMVRMQVGAVDKRLVVHGDRHWKNGQATAARPFVDMPLTWQNAFGGEGFGDNPAGKGAAASVVNGKRLLPLPNKLKFFMSSRTAVATF